MRSPARAVAPVLPAGRSPGAFRRAATTLGSLATLLVVLASPAAAQEPTPLTLLDAARRSLAVHPSVEAASAGARAARAVEASARAAWWPSLALDASATRFEEPMLVYPIHGFDLAGLDPSDPEIGGFPPFDETLVDATLGARWTVFEGGARGARIDRAAALAEAADADHAATRDGLLGRVVGTYLDVVVSRDVLSAHDRRIEAMTAERERVRLAVEEGGAARVDLTRVEAALAKARADRVDAAATLDVAAGDLARLLESEADPAALAAAVAAPEIALDLPGARASLLDAPERSPRVARARAEASAAEAAEDAARAAWLPTVSARGAYVERGSPGVDEWQGEWQAGVVLEYPIFTGGARRADVDRARAERSAARARLRAIELETAGAAQRAGAALDRALARRDALESAVERFAEVARVEALALEVGSGVQADWLDAVADLLEARAALAKAKAAIVRAAAERARVTGDLSIDWLESRLEEAP